MVVHVRFATQQRGCAARGGGIEVQNMAQSTRQIGAPSQGVLTVLSECELWFALTDPCGGLTATNLNTSVTIEPVFLPHRQARLIAAA